MRKRCILFILPFFAFVTVDAFDAGAAEPAKAGPKYFNLRYDEDFSYLSGPDGSYVKDPWDSIKWIPIGDDWHLTLGGQARLRFESETDKSFGSGTGPSHDAFLLQRYFIHADIKHAAGLRFFLQGKFAHANFRDKGGFIERTGNSDSPDLFYAQIEYKF